MAWVGESIFWICSILCVAASPLPYLSTGDIKMCGANDILILKIIVYAGMRSLVVCLRLFGVSAWVLFMFAFDIRN